MPNEDKHIYLISFSWDNAGENDADECLAELTEAEARQLRNLLKWYVEDAGDMVNDRANVEPQMIRTFDSAVKYIKHVRGFGPEDEEEDKVLTADQLQRKYDDMVPAGGGWGEYPTYGREDWRNEVADENTQLGYWDWVVNQIEQAIDEVNQEE